MKGLRPKNRMQDEKTLCLERGAPGNDNKERHEVGCGAVVTKKVESCLSEFSGRMLLREVEGRIE